MARGDAIANLHIRISPELKAALERCAEADHRPLSQYVTKLFREAVARDDAPATKKRSAAR
jgi:hypothetical protein